MGNIKKFEDFLDRMRGLLDNANRQGHIIVRVEDLENTFPELKDYEGEDEKIRKALIRFHKSTIDIDGIKGEDIIAWLEKQGEKTNWCHHKVDLSNCSEEYRKAYYDGWNNCNIQHSQEKSESNDVVKCLINGMKFYYEDNKEATWGTEKFSMKVKDILAWLEKQGEQKPTDKVEPKFHKGDWIVYDMPDGRKTVRQIVNMTNKSYVLDGEGFNTSYFNDLEDDYHLWTIQDTKDGDVLACGDKVYDCPFIFHNLTEKQNPRSYCGIDTSGEFQYNDENGGFWCKSDEVRPSTKEQRDLLFQKMKEAGYQWNPDKKELKKIEDEIEIPFGAKDSELQDENSIEYTRTDAFIEKAWNWVEDNLLSANQQDKSRLYFEQFVKHMRL